MTGRQQRQAEAERAVRRGELKLALSLYRTLLCEEPGDQAVRGRIEAIESLVQPQELSEPRVSPLPPPDLELARPATSEQTAEMLLEHGDLDGAIATYQRLLVERPEHQLARERCRELEQLRSQGSGPSRPSKPGQDSPEILQSLLARIAARRRV